MRLRRSSFPGIRAARPALALGLFILLALPSLAVAKRWRPGEAMRIAGQVSDAAGNPVSGVTVLLEMSRERFRVSRWARERQGLLRLPTVTDADGRFVLRWSWDSYYNGFALVVALPIRSRGKEDLKIFLRRDLGDSIKNSGPSLATNLVLGDTTYLEWLKGFLQGISSPAQARTYEELGLPDQVDSEAGSAEASWWYFSIGQVYRFRQGEIEQVQEFEPIRDP